MSPVRVLVVDDQEVFRRVMSAVVEHTEGFVLVGCRIGRDRRGSRVCPGSDPDGREPPGSDGMEATRRLREDRTAATVVLLSTNEDDWMDRRRSAGRWLTLPSAFGPDGLTAVWAGTGG